MFLVVTRKANEFQEGTNFFAWGCAIARFKLLELCCAAGARSQALSEEVIEALCSVDWNPRLDDSRLAIHGIASNNSRPKARQMMYLRYYGEHSPA